MSLIADPWVMNLMPAQPHTLVEIDHEIYSTFILFLPLIIEGLLSYSGQSMYTEYCFTAYPTLA